MFPLGHLLRGKSARLSLLCNRNRSFSFSSRTSNPKTRLSRIIYSTGEISKRVRPCFIEDIKNHRKAAEMYYPSDDSLNNINALVNQTLQS